MALMIIVGMFGGGILMLAVSDRTGIKIIGLFLISGSMIAFSISHEQGPPVMVYFPTVKKDSICIPIGRKKEREILADMDTGSGYTKKLHT